MAYLGSWKVDDYLTFCCNTHDPDTGVATDAGAVPTYRVYEDETGAAILSGVTAKLDDANTTGFYSERIQLTAANGFEKGKCYTVYISATVDSDTGTMHHNFQMEAEVDVNTASGLHADLVDGGRLDLLIDAIKAVTDALPDAGALDDLALILADTNALPDNGALNDLATILADTGELQTDWADGGRLDLILDAAGGAGDPWSTAIPGAYGAGTAGKILGDNINAPIATIDTVVDAIKTITDALPDAGALSDLATILTDTGELQTDWADGGRLDLLIDAIKVVTDALPDAGALNDLAAILADTDTDGVAISATAANAIADAVLKRGVDNVEATADMDSLTALILSMLHSSISAATWTIKRTDDSTTFDTKDVTVDAAADPVTGVADP